jgi:hypothetical protein
MVTGGFKVHDVQGWKAGTWTGTVIQMGEQGTGISLAKAWYSEGKRKPKYKRKYTRDYVRKVNERKEIFQKWN